jgi:hypothetical protein
MFDTVRTMHYEVDMVVQKPFDATAERFLTDVQSSADRVLRFRGDATTITITIEAHAMDQDGVVEAARGEIARIDPGGDYQEAGEPRQIS